MTEVDRDDPAKSMSVERSGLPAPLWLGILTLIIVAILLVFGTTELMPWGSFPI